MSKNFKNGQNVVRWRTCCLNIVDW